VNDWIWKLLPTAVLGLIQALFGWALWSIRKEFVSRESCAKQHGACKSVAKLEREIEKLDLTSLRVALEATRAEMAGVRELLARTEYQLGLLMEHHLERRGKA